MHNIQIAFFDYFLSTGNELIYNYFPKAQQVKHVKGVPEKEYFSQDQT
jgi:hypothetical protein